jgi:hypothetical protein
MKFTYEFIKENLRIYQEAKESLPTISDYENGLVSFQVMKNIGLDKFAEFYNFQKNLSDNDFSTIQAINFKELKQILIEKTKSERFKTWLKNKTVNSFKRIIEEDSQTFDRLLNGRWISKPGYTYRGRKIWGRRSNEVIDGFDTSFIPLLNWIISNDIDTCEKSECDIYKKFTQQDKYLIRIKYYSEVCLSLDLVPKVEIEVTRNLLNSLVGYIESSNIDFRKLNSDFITDTLQNKIRSLMTIYSGVKIRSKVDLKTNYGTDRLTKGKDYVVESSSISSGFLRVLIVDDSGLRNWYDYKEFEDKSIERDLILNQLGIF